jgi:hypothetical protein
VTEYASLSRLDWCFGFLQLGPHVLEFGISLQGLIVKNYPFLKTIALNEPGLVISFTPSIPDYRVIAYFETNFDL